MEEIRRIIENLDVKELKLLETLFLFNENAKEEWVDYKKFCNVFYSKKFDSEKNIIPNLKEKNLLHNNGNNIKLTDKAYKYFEFKFLDARKKGYEIFKTLTGYLSNSEYKDLCDKSVLKNALIRQFVEPLTLIFGAPKYNSNGNTNFRYVSENIYKNLKKINGLKSYQNYDNKLYGKTHYEHVVPLNLFYNTTNKEDIYCKDIYNGDFEKFISTLQEKLFVCGVTEEENKRLDDLKLKSTMPDNQDILTDNFDIFARYKEAKIKIYDLYTQDEFSL